MTASEMDRRAQLPARPAPAEPEHAVEPPAPGIAVLACRCGAVLDAADMRRRRGRHPGGQPIAAIVCKECVT